MNILERIKDLTDLAQDETLDEDSIADSGMRIPTVKERLEAETPYAVMDSESAKRSSALLEQQIAMIQEWCEELPVNLSAMGDVEVEASLFLDDVISPGVLSGGRTLNDPDFASFFLINGKIYDSPFAA